MAGETGTDRGSGAAHGGGLAGLQRDPEAGPTLSLLTHDQQVPGNTGETATPTAAVVFALFAHVALVQIPMNHREGHQVYGIQPHHLLICDALGLNHAWYAAPSAYKNGTRAHTP